MRSIDECEPTKRGCKICADVKKRKVFAEIQKKIVTRMFCPYDECPYHELDNVKDYSEYDKQMQKMFEGILRLD